MVRRFSVVALILMIGLAGSSFAQPIAVPQSPVLVLDADRLFERSAFAQRARQAIRERQTALDAEFADIAAELEAEEQDLTEQRATLPSDEFRNLADAFNTKVLRFRERQETESRRLNEEYEKERLRFFSVLAPVLEAMMREAGAAVIVDARDVLIHVNAVDITELAIAEVDRVVGDGSEPAEN